MSKFNRLSFVSKRYYKQFSGDSTAREAIEYYRNTIKKYANTDCNTNQLFKLMFGENWYDEPFSKLYKLLKMSSQGSYIDRPYKSAFTKNDVRKLNEMIRKEESKLDSSMVRICKKFYPASLIDKLASDKRANVCANYYQYDTFEQHMVQLARLASYVKHYDKQSLKKLKKAKTVEQLCQLSNCSGDVLKYNHGCYGNDLRESMTKKQHDEVIKRAIQSALKRTFGTKAEQELGSLEETFLSQQCWAYSRTTCVGGLGKYSQRAFNNAAKATAELDKLYDFESMLNELHLENAYITTGWHREHRLNGKIYKVVKQLKREFDKGMPLEVVQQVAVQQTGAIRRMNYNSRVWAPELRIKEDI